MWILVLLADFVLEFRFEYLWPFWLFIRSVYDSFRYQGLVSDQRGFGMYTRARFQLMDVSPPCSSQAFSVFFVCVAFTSDIICLLFIPVQWLFFAASTYVWVQYVWHTGRSHSFSSNEPFFSATAAKFLPIKRCVFPPPCCRERRVPTDGVPLDSVCVH